jgi:MFS family permease
MNRTITLRLSIAFGLIYFFSTNGLASLPTLAIKFLLKDMLKLTASQSAYFSAITLLGWGIKPLWGIISDTVPVFGYRRKSYLILTSIAAAGIWFYLGQMENYTVGILLAFFTLSSFAYAFNDVVTDGLMVQTGKRYDCIARFQSVQWGAVYVASIFTGLAGGWVAEHWTPQRIFSFNAVFPLLVLSAVLFLISEEKSDDYRKQREMSLRALKNAAKNKTIWLVAFFLFFWTFRPSVGNPFLYYAIDTLLFGKFFLGIGAAVGSVGALMGSVFFNRYAARFRTKALIHFAILFAIASTLFDLIYFTSFITQNLWLAKIVYVSSAAILGMAGAFVFLTLLNLSGIICPKYSEGTTFAALMSFWNIGQAGSEAFGGWLFDQIGLQPLILVSALCAALTWFMVPYLKFENAAH